MSLASVIHAGLGARGSAAGIAYMLLSNAFIASTAAIGRFTSLEGYAVLQIVFLRLLLAGLFLAPALAIRGPSLLITPHWRLYIARVLVGLCGMSTWFAALSFAPLGEVTAIGFLTPVFATLGAALFLHEQVDRRRWLAVFAGFVGAFIILRPGAASASAGLWLALLAAVAMAGATLLIKQLADRDDPERVVMITTCMQTAIMAVPAMLVWQWPPPFMWAVFIGLGLMGLLSQLFFARALRAADASVVAPAEFARLPFAVFIGFILFGELVDLWVWVGAGIIFVASALCARQRRFEATRSPQ